MPKWWTTETYDDSIPVPSSIVNAAGPQGVALVRVWQDGRTDPGWGLRKSDDPVNTGFMWKYEAGAFLDIPIVWGFQQRRWNFALVMRSLRLVCIDIDGKNGGLTGIGKLGMLPKTLAETSKSGDGYHLFYATSEDMWDEKLGFNQFSDRINLEQGVDLRATGCVYHYAQQRWNRHKIVELPPEIKKRLTTHTQAQAAQVSGIVKTIQTEDEGVILTMQESLIEDLAKDITPGRRNTTLYAIGSQMKLAQIPDWEKHVFDRATQLGLDMMEANKIVANIAKYGGN